MITDIRFCARLDAEAQVKQENPNKVAIVSITDPAQAPALQGWQGRILRLSFLDVILTKGASADNAPPAFNEQMGHALVQFLEELNESPKALTLLVHCEFGASRSAAVALYAEAFTGADLHRRYLAFGGNRHVLDVLQKIRPLPQPVELPVGPKVA